MHAAIWYSRIESGLALLVSFLINLAVVLAFWRHFYRVECASMEGGPFVCVGADALGEGDVGYGACNARGGRLAAAARAIPWAAAGELPTPPAAAGLAQCMPIDLERAGTLTVARTLTLTLTLTLT